jgi:hypothetical protein
MNTRKLSAVFVFSLFLPLAPAQSQKGDARAVPRSSTPQNLPAESVRINLDDLIANAGNTEPTKIYDRGAATNINREVEQHGRRHNVELQQKRAAPPQASSSDSAADGAGWIVLRRISKNAWWNEGGVVIRCLRGRERGEEKELFTDKNGMWEAIGRGGKQRVLDSAAQWACSLN